jgi:hypothetical protein
MLLELKAARLSRLKAAKGNSIAQKMNYMTEKRWSGDKRNYERTSRKGHKERSKGVDLKTWK